MINYHMTVRELRDKLVMSQAEFAKFFGVSFASINCWETGTYTPIITTKKK